MTTTYTTRDGDTVDYVCWKYYGNTESATVVAVLDANVGLADAGPVLSAGRTITLPEVTTPATTAGVKLWD